MLKRIRRAVLRRVLAVYKARKQRSAVLTREHGLAVARAMLGRAKYCFLITHGADGWSSARLVQPIVDEVAEFVLWFGTDPSLRKGREIEADPRVTVTIEDRRQDASLVLYGTASLERDPAVRRRRWIGTWRLFFPAGPTSNEYVAIRFEAERIELMNFARNVVPEPFGLRPLTLIRRRGQWVLANGTLEHAAQSVAAGDGCPGTPSE